MIFRTSDGAVIAETGTGGQATTDLAFQGDGNLVLYNNVGYSFATNTGDHRGTQVVLENNGNLVFYAGSTPIWNSNGDITTPAIIKTVYGTEDVVVADYVATNQRYGADPTGVADSTAAIQSALIDCFNSGGGTVYLPAGTYRVTNTISVPSFVTLRGDWRDPDAGSGSYGTVIQADLASGANSPVLFQIGGSAGVMGLTTFYPNQNAGSPVFYNYTFYIPSGSWSGMPMSGTYMSSNIINCTMLNSYLGIGINPWDIGKAHETATVKNVKGTALYRGLMAYNSADVDTYEHITFNNSYWANAGGAYNAPDLGTLNNWTRANGIAFTLGDLEWAQFYAINCSDYYIGIHTVPGSRTQFSGEFLWANIQNTTIAVQADSLFNGPAGSSWGMSFLSSVLNGSSFSIINYTLSHVYACNSTINGLQWGSVTLSAPGASPVSYAETSCPKVTRAVLYNVAAAPYNAPYSMPQTGLPAADATAAIQAALNDAGNAGGGVVYLPAGWYRLNSHLTVPANVELRGSSSVPTRDQSDLSYGTVLLGYEGAGTANPDWDPALVTLNGYNAGIRGIRFFYPNNNPQGGWVNSYPYTIRGTGANQYAVNIGLTGVYNGIDFASYPCNNHVIRKVVGVAYRTFIAIGASTQGWVEGNLSNPASVARCNFGVPNWVWEDHDGDHNIFNKVIDPITRPNEILLSLNSTSNENVLNNFAYGAHIGVNTAYCDVNIFNLGTDNLGTGGYSAGGFNTNIKLLNVMKYNGNFSSHAGSGTITLYNPMTL